MLTYSYTGELDISAVQKDIESTLGSNVTLQTGSSIASDAQTLTLSLIHICWGVAGWLTGLIVDGIIGGVGAVLGLSLIHI